MAASKNNKAAQSQAQTHNMVQCNMAKNGNIKIWLSIHTHIHECVYTVQQGSATNSSTQESQEISSAKAFQTVQHGASNKEVRKATQSMMAVTKGSEHM